MSQLNYDCFENGDRFEKNKIDDFDAITRFFIICLSINLRPQNHFKWKKISKGNLFLQSYFENRLKIIKVSLYIPGAGFLTANEAPASFVALF